jgi:hypothetical protein
MRTHLSIAAGFSGWCRLGRRTGRGDRARTGDGHQGIRHNPEDRPVELPADVQITVGSTLPEPSNCIRSTLRT